MKKLLLGVVAAMVAVTLIACGSSTSSSTSTESTTKTSSSKSYSSTTSSSSKSTTKSSSSKSNSSTTESHLYDSDSEYYKEYNSGSGTYGHGSKYDDGINSIADKYNEDPDTVNNIYNMFGATP